jgi:hypothetical protein
LEFRPAFTMIPNVNKLSVEQLANYEQGVAFIKGIESPFKLRPAKVVEIVNSKIDGFNMALHTKCWKFYNARPREMNQNFKSEYAGYVEGFDGYLYSKQWANFLITNLKDEQELSKVKQQAI